MAYRALDGARLLMFHWKVVLFLTCGLTSVISENQVLFAEGPDCNTGKEVKLGAATVLSHYRRQANFSHNIDCQMKFVAEQENWRLMLDVEYLDIPDLLYNGVCNDALYIYDSNSVQGERPFRQAGGNNGLCGQSTSSVLVSTGPYISLYFRTNENGPVGKGFKLQITAFSEVGDKRMECSTGFLCQTTRTCIESDLRCDRVAHCTDSSDEEDEGSSNCNPVEESGIWKMISDIGIAGCVGILVGGIMILVLLIICMICTWKRCERSSGETDHRQSIPSSTHGSVGAGQAGLQVTKDGVLYHQVPQTAPHMGPQMMNHSLNHYSQDGTLPGSYGPNPWLQHSQPIASLQRPSYVSNQPMMDRPIPMGYMPPHVQATGFSYNSPLHQPRVESHSHSSGYSSQQGALIGGFQPMHTKPIIPQQGYTPTSGSSHSSHSVSESDVTYSRPDHRHNKLSLDRGRGAHLAL